MRSKLRWAIVPGLVLAASVVLAACGSDSDDSGDEGASQAEVSGALEEFAPATAAPEGAQQGGELTVLAAADVGAGYTDPGIAYYQFAYMVTAATQRALLSWQPDDVEKPTPDLAEAEPEISDDFKTITFTIRDGVKFAPPVDREVVCDDVKYAIDRGLMPGVGNGYIGAYLGDLAGFAEAQKQAEQNQTKAPDIAGVQCTDDKTLELTLDRPTAAVAVQALSLPLSAPVPEEYAKQFDAEQPSTYAD
ncbi:MAG: hypothetical protein GEU88_15290, partial [Solirubrobacterales bacterium]|nr:hypothetical protein [Solirubrobacterales bacterium]